MISHAFFQRYTEDREWSPFVPRPGISPVCGQANLIFMNTFGSLSKQQAMPVLVKTALVAALAKVPANAPAGPFLNTLGREIADARP